jgi:hypothetical protein
LRGSPCDAFNEQRNSFYAKSGSGQLQDNGVLIDTDMYVAALAAC